MLHHHYKQGALQGMYTSKPSAVRTSRPKEEKLPSIRIKMNAHVQPPDATLYIADLPVNQTKKVSPTLLRRMALEQQMKERMNSQIINPYQWRERISTKAKRHDSSLAKKVTDVIKASSKQPSPQLSIRGKKSVRISNQFIKSANDPQVLSRHQLKEGGALRSGSDLGKPEPWAGQGGDSSPLLYKLDVAGEYNFPSSMSLKIPSGQQEPQDKQEAKEKQNIFKFLQQKQMEPPLRVEKFVNPNKPKSPAFVKRGSLGPPRVYQQKLSTIQDIIRHNNGGSPSKRFQKQTMPIEKEGSRAHSIDQESPYSKFSKYVSHPINPATGRPQLDPLRGERLELNQSVDVLNRGATSRRSSAKMSQGTRSPHRQKRESPHRKQPSKDSLSYREASQHRLKNFHRVRTLATGGEQTLEPDSEPEEEDEPRHHYQSSEIREIDMPSPLTQIQVKMSPKGDRPHRHPMEPPYEDNSAILMSRNYSERVSPPPIYDQSSPVFTRKPSNERTSRRINLRRSEGVAAPILHHSQIGDLSQLPYDERAREDDPFKRSKFSLRNSLPSLYDGQRAVRMIPNLKANRAKQESRQSFQKYKKSIEDSNDNSSRQFRNFSVLGPTQQVYEYQPTFNSESTIVASSNDRRVLPKASRRRRVPIPSNYNISIKQNW